MASRRRIRKGAIVSLTTAILFCLAGGALARSVQPSGYEVELGDTLYSIAARQLGSGPRWTEIARLNGLTDGQGIRPGQILQLPPEAAVTGLRPGAGHQHFDTGADPRRRPFRLHRGVEIVPRGRVVMVLPAPGHHRREHRHLEIAGGSVQGAELPSAAGSRLTSLWELADGMAFLVGAGASFAFASRGTRRLVRRR